MDYAKESLRLHGEWKGKIEVVTRVPVETKDDLSLAYTPGVAQPEHVPGSNGWFSRSWPGRYRTGGRHAGYGRKMRSL